MLRPARADDLDDLFEVYADAGAMRYWSTPPHPDRATTERLLDGIRTQPEPHLYRVVEMDGRAIGTAGIHAGTEIGFILHPRCWGRGVATELLGGLVPWLFETTGFEHLTADIDPRNTASAAVLRKAGFVETGRAARTWCIAGEWSDSVYFRRARDRPAKAPTGR